MDQEILDFISAIPYFKSYGAALGGKYLLFNLMVGEKRRPIVRCGPGDHISIRDKCLKEMESMGFLEQWEQHCSHTFPSGAKIEVWPGGGGWLEIEE